MASNGRRSSLRSTAWLLSFCGLVGSPAAAESTAWFPPGDVGLRHDLRLLADAGVLDAPLLAWPLPPEALQLDGSEDLPPLVLSALERVATELGRARRSAGGYTGLAAAESPRRLRTFEATPREEAELFAGGFFNTDRFSGQLQLTLVADPEDGNDIRPDGSYLAMRLGNTRLTAGYLERWWGPGWDGSLILSTSARPMPALGWDRLEPRAFKTKWLSWLGPWTASVFLAQMESERADVDEPLFFGLRVGVRPLRGLEIGLARTAQWCGEGRPCDFDAFTDLLLGNDNAGLDIDPEDEPGNQLAGFDIRWASPLIGDLPYALYWQRIGEDESGGRPIKNLGLFGLEVWGGFDNGSSWRAHIEYADTACSYGQSPPIFDCAYRNRIFNREGYRFRGRSIGHGLDADAESWSGALLYIDAAGHSWRLFGRGAKLNRGGNPDPDHSVTSVPQSLREVAFTHSRRIGRHRVDIGLGYDEREGRPTGPREDDWRAWVAWQREF